MKTQLQLAAFICKCIIIFQFWNPPTLSAENNPIENAISIQTLQNEVSENKYVFNAMKNELQKARHTNIRKRNVISKREVNEETQNKTQNEVHEATQNKTQNEVNEVTINKTPNEVAQYKTMGQYKTPEEVARSVTSLARSKLEDQYVKHFGNSDETQFWDMARVWYLELREPRLKRFSNEAHKQAGFGEKISNNTQVRPRMLVFDNPNYVPRMVDITMYGIKGECDMHRDRFFFWLWRDDYWYMTEGERDDCVYYVTHANKTIHTFKLVQHVCGIFIDVNLRRDVAYF